jgi:hypothetical protein
MRLIVVVSILMTVAMIALALWVGTIVVGSGSGKRVPRIHPGGGGGAQPTSLVLPAGLRNA